MYYEAVGGAASGEDCWETVGEVRGGVDEAVSS